MQHCSVSDVNRQAVQQGSGADKGDVAERALQRAVEEYRLQRPELVRTDKYLLDAEASVRLLLSFLVNKRRRQSVSSLNITATE